MKRVNFIIVLLSFVLLIGLAYWQVRHLIISQNLQVEIENQDMQFVLKNSAVEIRKAEASDSTIRTDLEKRRIFIDSIIAKNFNKYNRDFSWGEFNGNKDPINATIHTTYTEALKNTALKVCTSCLVMINMMNENGEGSFMLDQNPSQMIEIKGIKKEDIQYLHVFTSPKTFSFYSLIYPLLFLVSLSSLFIWLLFLNGKQSKLIKQKNEFVNHLSHQFQTPLSSIKLSANLIAKNKGNQNELIQIIQTESNRLENHIKTVLHWVKSDADRLFISKEKIGITGFIEIALKQMKPIFLTNKTKVNFIPPEEELYIEADVNHLELMLFNIWENAIKHNNHKIEITIQCKINKGFVQISISDNGKGIDNEISDIKFRGLGLAYINRIMNEHSGSMELISKTKKGLTVNLNFPKYG